MLHITFICAFKLYFLPSSSVFNVVSCCKRFELTYSEGYLRLFQLVDPKIIPVIFDSAVYSYNFRLKWNRRHKEVEEISMISSNSATFRVIRPLVSSSRFLRVTGINIAAIDLKFWRHNECQATADLFAQWVVMSLQIYLLGISSHGGFRWSPPHCNGFPVHPSCRFVSFRWITLIYQLNCWISFRTTPPPFANGSSTHCQLIKYINANLKRWIHLRCALIQPLSGKLPKVFHHK